MWQLIIGIFIGATIMDFLWAWRLGIPQSMYRRFKSRNDRNDIG